jgi:hypothetical protein
LTRAIVVWAFYYKYLIFAALITKQIISQSRAFLKPSNKAIMSQFDTSISKMKASFDAISAAKTHTVLLDFVPDRKTTGKAGTTKKVTTRVAKPVEKPVAKLVEAEYTKQPGGIQGVIAEEVVSKTTKKAAPKKSSKLSKMLRGKVVDCTA